MSRMMMHMRRATALRRGVQTNTTRAMSTIPSWAKANPYTMSQDNQFQGQNLVNGQWKDAKATEAVVDPMNGQVIMNMPDTQVDELPEFIDSMKATPRHGKHNPMKNVERYLMYGNITNRMAEALRDEATFDYFCKLIQRVAPKSDGQAHSEVLVTRNFLENFSGDQVRFLARSFSVPGDHQGQQSNGFRWPYGPVSIITPFNYPFEIPLLQLMGALFMGNKPTLKVDTKVSVVMEETLRLMIDCGMPADDVDLIHSNGPVMNELLREGKPKNTLFTGSSHVAEHLSSELNGKIKLEDAGFDWKFLGPDVQDEDYVAHVCDQDAYAFSGQKCSAQSIMFMHNNWVKNADIEKRIKDLAAQRKLDNLTIGPVLTQTTENMLKHKDNLLNLPGARLAFGGEELENHTIPKQYGAIKPTAVFVPLKEVLKPENFDLITTEIFGPFQVLTEYNDDDLPEILNFLDNMKAFLTAAVVSNDPYFQQEILSHTINGTTYTGIRARTTGAPQNHFFGPAGDPRGGTLGTPEAIKHVWSCHREIIQDIGPVPQDFTIPERT